MGRLGPLTSQALGRSPYDDVVEGEGEADPREPERRYDEKGRIYNPETKTIIKNTIRAHNEVMHVIGVAEPEDSSAAQEEAALIREHRDYETETGKTLFTAGQVLTQFSTWGVHGLRTRVLVYRPYSHVEFSRLLQFELTRRSYPSMALAGIPSFLSVHGAIFLGRHVDAVRQRPRLRAALNWCQYHLELYITLQRLGLVPASQLLPHPLFFVPFSSSSPLALPPPMSEPSMAAIGGWLVQITCNVAPYLGYVAFKYMTQYVFNFIMPRIHARLPQPKAQGNNGRPRAPERPPIMAESLQAAPESPTLGAADREIRHSRSPDQDMATLQALEGQGSGADPGIPLGAIRRQSTFSSRGGDQDYGTDEEDGDLINPTLISFDVDTSDSPEPPAGVWSAELRPSHGGENRSQRSEPKYVVNALTKLPATLAAANLGAFATIVVCAPIEALMLRTLARTFAQRHGLSCDEMFNIRLHDSMSWRGIANFLGIQIVGVLIGGEVWSLLTVISQWLHVTEEEWREIHMEEEAERTERAERAARETTATRIAEDEA